MRQEKLAILGFHNWVSPFSIFNRMFESYWRYIRKLVFSHFYHLFRLLYHEIDKKSMKSWRCHDEILTPFGWNLRRAASDEIKSVLSLPAKRDFIAKWFHPTLVGFIPSARTDLTEKRRLQKQSSFFLAGAEGLDSRANCALGLPRSRTSTGSSLCAVSPSSPPAHSKRKGTEC